MWWGDLQLWRESVSVWEKSTWPWVQLSTKSSPWLMRGYNIQTRGQGMEKCFKHWLACFLSFLPPFFPSSSSKSNTKSCKMETLQIQHIQSKLPNSIPLYSKQSLLAFWCMFLQISPCIYEHCIITMDFSQNGVIHSTRWPALLHVQFLVFQYMDVPMTLHKGFYWYFTVLDNALENILYMHPFAHDTDSRQGQAHLRSCRGGT